MPKPKVMAEIADEGYGIGEGGLNNKSVMTYVFIFTLAEKNMPLSANSV